MGKRRLRDSGRFAGRALATLVLVAVALPVALAVQTPRPALAAACDPDWGRDGLHAIAIFSSVGTCDWTPHTAGLEVEYLIIAGGGGGGGGGLGNAGGVGS